MDAHDRSAAIFLDRDGVLVEDRGLLVDPAGLRIVDGVPLALRKLKEAGFRLIVITNQAVVARGMITEEGVEAIHTEMQRMLDAAGAPRLNAIYFCPHHPEANLPEYRVVCECRKPRPGSLLRAAQDHRLDLDASFMVGDRVSDIGAGAAAGCRTVLLKTAEQDISAGVAVAPPDDSPQPDYVCPDLLAAVDWILRERQGPAQ
jgi:D-glycero-D-manno-heptose 1,7-bisphosphate phosphatase